MTTIVCHAYDFIIKDCAGYDDQTVIHCWALDVDSNPYLLIINNFPVFCILEIPIFIGRKEYEWDMYKARDLVRAINKFLNKDQQIIKCDFLKCQPLYYYQGARKAPFIRVYFTNVRAMNSCKYKLQNAFMTEQWGLIQCNILENQIDVVRKLLTIRNIRYSKWFSVQGIKVEEELHISTIENEYNIDWTTMTTVADDVCKTWMTYPGVLSWDIETYSTNHRAMPDKFNHKHVVWVISAIFKKYKHDDTIKRYGIIIGDCNQIPKEKLENCIVINVTTEYELAEAFAKVVNDTDPEILTGYNIFGYDISYLNHRISRQCKDWPKMSRIKGEVPQMNTSRWKSAAYGHNNNYTLNISGRIFIDLLPVVKRDYKLDTYTLNHVCTHFIQKQKHDISAVQMFQAYEEMQIAINNYNTEPSVTNKNKLEEAKIKTTEVLEYCIQDSVLVLELMEALEVWVGLIELSNIVGVTIVEIFTKGQQVRCLSQLYDLASRKNYVINIREDSTFSFCGGAVASPIAGIYDNIICLDFKSLYPSIIQACNICYTTLVAPEHMSYIPDTDCHVIEFDQEEEEELVKKEKEEALATEEENEGEMEVKDNDVGEEDIKEVKIKKVKVKKHYKFKYYKNKEGLLPLLVKNLVAERNAVRKLQKTEKNPHIWMVLEKRQLALKVSANSFFGFLGVREGGKLPLIEGAMSITGKGRELIGEVGSYLSNKYGAKIVYGDSVTGDTPILCKLDDVIKYYTIATLPCNKYTVYWDKEISLPVKGLQVWSDKGFTPIIKIIRHRTSKKLYRIVTTTGLIDVTEDHSLLNMYGDKVRPKDVKVGDILLHANLPVIGNAVEAAAELQNALQNKYFKTKLDAAELYLLSNSQGHNITFDTSGNMVINQKYTNHSDQIISITKLPTTYDYVYDLETNNHHFAAGVGRLIVHNTDSVMIDMNIKDSKECQYWGELLSQEISGVKIGDKLPGTVWGSGQVHKENIKGLFCQPLEMEFEKAMRLFCIKKKKYAAYLIDDDGTFIKKTIKDKNGKVIKELDELEMLLRGICLIRRDNCPYLKGIYCKILNIIMDGGTFKDAIVVLIDNILRLVNNEVPYLELKSTRELGANYKQASNFMKVFSDELRKQNKFVNPGDRLEFLVIDKETELLGQKMVLLSDYKEALKTDTPFKLDIYHYIEKVLQNPIDQLFLIGFGPYIESNLKHIKFKPKNKREPFYLDTPAEMCYHLLKNGIKLEKFKDIILTEIEKIGKPIVKLNIVK